MPDNGHIDINKLKRMGWFLKKEDGQPIPNYIKSCKSSGKGYLGPRFEAHHILPQTSIEESVNESGKDLEYLSIVKYITNWNINKSGNMIGLPHYHAYDLYYQASTTLSDQVGNDQTNAMVKWFNKFSEKSRKKWLARVLASSPEGHPVHNPVNWGHTKYNVEVKSEIKTNIWDEINDKKKEHELDAKAIEGALDALAQIFNSKLISRDTSKDKWDERKNPQNNTWYKPFTMTDVPNPLFG